MIEKNSTKEMLKKYRFNCKKRDRISKWIVELESQRELDDLEVVLLSSLRDLLDSQLAVCEKEHHKLIKVTALIDDDLERDVVRMKYIHGLEVNEIAAAIDYSERQVYRMLNQGMENVSVKLE